MSERRAEGDDLDTYIEEQMKDPEFARAYAEAEQRAAARPDPNVYIDCTHCGRRHARPYICPEQRDDRPAETEPISSTEQPTTASRSTLWRVVCPTCDPTLRSTIYEGDNEWRARRFCRGGHRNGHDVRLQRAVVSWEDVFTDETDPVNVYLGPHTS